MKKHMKRPGYKVTYCGRLIDSSSSRNTRRTTPSTGLVTDSRGVTCEACLGAMLRQLGVNKRAV